MSPSSFDEPQFLEPAHHHDPTKISNVANIPAALLEDLPVDAQKALWNIQESASVAYASYRRLRDLSKERFHRLVPAKKQDHDVEAIQYSEPAFQNYINSLQAEKTYFLEEATVDFRHKALRIDFAGHHDKKLCINGKDTTPVKWWATLQGIVEGWLEVVEDIDIPDFEETVDEFRVFQARESRKNLAREERNRRRKTIMDLERPDFCERRLTLEKLDSAVVVD